MGKMQKRKILILDKTHRVLVDNLSNNGFDLEIHTDWTPKELFENIEYYDGLVVRSKMVIDRSVIDKAVRLKCIARVGAGMDAIDVDYAQSKGIVCLNSPEGNRDAVGEHCLGMLLALLNKITIGDRQVRKGLWLREENRGVEIKGKTVGIIGYGNMGNAFAKSRKYFLKRTFFHFMFRLRRKQNICSTGNSCLVSENRSICLILQGERL